ncbi:MAG: alpha/beta hydrolase [Alphaproteobacteria bacterium]|nr:alpha/beta hydrolase [Alphaproteobacteria bacterium]
MLKHIAAGVLDIAYEESGPASGPPVILSHGFPYDVRAYDEAAVLLAASGRRVLVPYLRGYGPTRFLKPETPRSGEQAALAADLLAFMDALAIPKATLAGYDWGGRASCIVSALWPERVRGLITGNGYNVQNIPKSLEPASPEAEHRFWYQYYLHGERGRAGLTANRYEFCKLLWRLWSPNWRFDEATYARTASSFDNPDFVEVVVHSYRHRFKGLAPGDSAVAAIEKKLEAQPSIAVPAISIDGTGDGVTVTPTAAMASHPRFSGPFSHRLIPLVGHNLPQEAPREFADAILSLP